MRVWEWFFDGDCSVSDPIEVEYSFDAGEREVTYHLDGSGQPATPSSVDIVRFRFKGVDVTNLIWELAHSNVIDELEMEIAEHEESGGGYDIEDFFD